MSILQLILAFHQIIIHLIQISRVTFLFQQIIFVLLELKHSIMQAKVGTKYIKDLQTPPLRVSFNIPIDFLYPFINIVVILSHASIFNKGIYFMVISETSAAALSTTKLLLYPLFMCCPFSNNPGGPWSPAAVPVQYTVIYQWYSSTLFYFLLI